MLALQTQVTRMPVGAWCARGALKMQAFRFAAVAAALLAYAGGTVAQGEKIDFSVTGDSAVGSEDAVGSKGGWLPGPVVPYDLPSGPVGFPHTGVVLFDKPLQCAAVAKKYEREIAERDAEIAELKAVNGFLSACPFETANEHSSVTNSAIWAGLSAGCVYLKTREWKGKRDESQVSGKGTGN